MKKIYFLCLCLCIFAFSCKHQEEASGGGMSLLPEEPMVPEKPIYDHLTEISVFAGRNKGVIERQEFEGEFVTSVLKGELKNIDVLGVVANVYFLSKTVKFESVKVNGYKLRLNYDIGGGYKTVGCFVADLADSNSTILDFTIIADGKTSTGKLKLTRKNNLSDVPELALFINNKQVYINGDVVEDLSKDNIVFLEKEVLEDDGSANIQVVSLLKFIKEVKINGTSITPVEKIVGRLRYGSVAEHKEIITETKVFTIEIIPSRPELFQNVIWKFTIKK